MYCKICGNEISQEATFCNKCGKKLKIYEFPLKEKNFNTFVFIYSGIGMLLHPYWFNELSSDLSKLKSKTQFNKKLLIIPLIIISTWFLAAIISGIAAEEETYYGMIYYEYLINNYITEDVAITYFISSMIFVYLFSSYLSFKVVRIIKEHFNNNPESIPRFSSISILFFNVLYIQHKINLLVKGRN